MKKCRTCGEIKPIEDYWFTSNKINRFKDCPQCIYKHRKLNETEEEKERQSLLRSKWRRDIKAKLVTHFKNKCAVCKCTYHQSVFDFHHKEPHTKEGQVCTLGSYEKCLQEAKKCIMVCANCHRLIHHGEVQVGHNMHELEEVIV